MFLETYQDNIVPFSSIAKTLHEELLKKGITLATAESCTGGAIAKALVEHPDASKYLVGGVIAYTNRIKEQILGVTQIQEYGAVSEQVTEEMAIGVSNKLSADLALSVSGILGPGGATPTKPVGTICASIAYKGRIALSWTMRYHGSREHLLERCVREVLARAYFFVCKGGQK